MLIKTRFSEDAVNLSDFTKTLFALALLSVFTTAFAATEQRELHVIVEFDAQQTWTSDTEEFGHEHSKATTHQRYEFRTQLSSDSGLQSRNLLDPNLDARLKAKTIRLAQQAKQKLAAAGKPIQIPQTAAEKSKLVERMQEEEYACQSDGLCRRRVMELYTAVFAAAQYPDDVRPDAGAGRYLYFEPYPQCENYSQVTMQLSIEGEHYNKGEHKVVPFTEQRSADSVNTPGEVALCEHYLAVIDTQDAEQPLYLENVYLPSAMGTTEHAELGETARATEQQPMNGDVLAWVTERLKHAAATGSDKAVVDLRHPLNGISEDSGASHGQAKMSMTWQFSAPE